MTDLYDASRLVHATPITVTLHTRTAAGVTSSQVVPYVHKQAETLDNATTAPAVTESETTIFRLWAIELAGTVPRKGFRIELADGTFYSVTKVETLSKGRSFRCHARKDKPT